MKIPLKRLLCIALSIVMMAGFISMEAKAYSFKTKYIVTSLKQNTYVNKKSDESRDWVIYRQLYKINVAADGYIKVQGKKSLAAVGVYKISSIDTNKDNDDQLNKSLRETWGSIGKTYYQAVKKGSYYLYVGGDNKIKWSLVKSKTYDRQKNYCRAQATTFAKGKKKTVFFSYNYDFPRWYKIKLTKKQRITFTFKFLDNGSYSCRLTDSRGVDANPGFEGFYFANYAGKTPKEKTRVLPKGTYYFRLERIDDDQGDHEGRVCQISWN